MQFTGTELCDTWQPTLARATRSLKSKLYQQGSTVMHGFTFSTTFGEDRTKDIVTHDTSTRQQSSQVAHHVTCSLPAYQPGSKQVDGQSKSIRFAALCYRQCTAWA